MFASSVENKSYVSCSCVCLSVVACFLRCNVSVVWMVPVRCSSGFTHRQKLCNVDRGKRTRDVTCSKTYKMSERFHPHALEVLFCLFVWLLIWAPRGIAMLVFSLPTRADKGWFVTIDMDCSLFVFVMYFCLACFPRLWRH